MNNVALHHNLDFGQFARHLMATIVTLNVGPQKIRYHVHEDVLCKLRFFSAALTGRFREAKEKLIHMPDDDPEIVAKLIEYLYKGDYSDPEPNPISIPSSGPSSPGPPPQVGPSNSISSLVSESTATSLVPAAPGTPLGKAAPGTALDLKIFHAEVYVLADKYTCTGLMKLCMQKIDGCKVADNDELLKYWAVIYNISGSDSKLRIINKLDALEVVASRNWVYSLWETWPVEMMLVVEQYPEFARDMMVLLSRSK